MRRTLFLIPHEIAGMPLFGWGWALILLAIALSIRLAVAAKNGKPPGGVSAAVRVFRSEVWFWAITAAVVVFVLPMVELQNVDGEAIGIAIRGYGFLLLLGVVTAVAAAAYRAQSAGLNPDLIYGLAPWTFVGGILGARLFYVIQYREEYVASTWAETLGNALAFTGGGLVVYGGFIGGFIASAIFLMRNRMPLLKLGDVIVPCIFIGLMFGRLGCLMNGCCYGGRCEAGPTAIEFPPGSAVYRDQMISGDLIGLTIDDQTQRIKQVASGSVADREGVRVGQKIDQLAIDPSYVDEAARDIPADQAPLGLAASIDGKVYRWSPGELPARALPVRGTQVISSLAAAVMAVSLWGLGAWWQRRSSYRDGGLMFVGFAGYAVVRFALEWVRVDEGGQFGTGFSISQWVSLVVLIASIAGLAYLWGRRPGPGLSPPGQAETPSPG